MRAAEHARRRKIAVLLLVCDEEDRQKAREAAELRAEYRDMGTNRPRQSPIERQRLSWSAFRTKKIREKSFTRTFRMDPDAFSKLCEELRPLLQKNEEMAARSTPGGAISPEVRLAISLRYLAGGSYLDLCDIYNCARSTMYEVVWDTVDSINKTPSLALNFPSTQAECAAAAAGFKALICKNGVVKGVVAAVDGLFIKRRAPSIRETLHVTRFFNGHKMGYGLNLQAACDSRLRFVGASCNCPGGTNDVTAWALSYMDRLTENLPVGYM